MMMHRKINKFLIFANPCNLPELGCVFSALFNDWSVLKFKSPYEIFKR
jgi:hypothetical protein